MREIWTGKLVSWKVGNGKRNEGKKVSVTTMCSDILKPSELHLLSLCNAFKTVPSEFRNDPYRFNQGRGVYSPSLVPRIYHIILRGINRQRIFEDEQDYYKFIQTLKDAKKESGFELKTVLL